MTTPTAKANNRAPVSSGKANVKSETPTSNIQAKPKVVGGNADYTAPPKNTKTINAPSAKVDTNTINKGIDTDVKSVGVENKEIGEVTSKKRVVDGKKEYNVNGKWLTDKQFSALRQKAVRQAWKAEKELVEKTGRGSRDWTPDELEELLTTGKVKGYEGQHMKSANEYPDYAGDTDNIQF